MAVGICKITHPSSRRVEEVEGSVDVQERDEWQKVILVSYEWQRCVCARNERTTAIGMNIEENCFHAECTVSFVAHG